MKGEQGANGTLKRGSNDADYLTARIARDRPDVLERMKAGEFKSTGLLALVGPRPVRALPRLAVANLFAVDLDI